jgi:hypothetical protein
MTANPDDNNPNDCLWATEISQEFSGRPNPNTPGWQHEGWLGNNRSVYELQQIRCAVLLWCSSGGNEGFDPLENPADAAGFPSTTSVAGELQTLGADTVVFLNVHGDFDMHKEFGDVFWHDVTKGVPAAWDPTLLQQVMVGQAVINARAALHAKYPENYSIDKRYEQAYAKYKVVGDTWLGPAAWGAPVGPAW